MVHVAQQTLRKRSGNNFFQGSLDLTQNVKLPKKMKNGVLHSDATEYEEKLTVQQCDCKGEGKMAGTPC